MIDTTAARRTTLNGKTYEKGDTVTMPAQQFKDLEPTGRFTRAPAAKKAPSGAKADETKSSGAAD